MPAESSIEDTIRRIQAKVVEQSNEQQRLLAEMSEDLARIEERLGLSTPNRPRLGLIEGGRDDAR